MTRFSTAFSLTNSQANIDFVDIDLSTDTPLYLDPYAIQIRDDEWSTKCGDNIRSFFNELLDSLRLENLDHVMHLLSNLHEPNETFLGQSQGYPNGKAIGETKAIQLAEALRNSRAFETGMLSDISDAELFIRGIGRDTISDLTTNILRNLLAEYTRDQCILHDIDVETVRSIGPAWDIVSRNWVSRSYELPVWRGRAIVLVPKSCVRFDLSINSQEFYNFHMVEFLKSEYLNAGSSLVQTFKDGTQYVTKSSVKKRHPFIKDDLAAFVRDHPEILEQYKRLKGATGPLANDEVDLFFDEKPFARALIERLESIEPGNSEANIYHSVAMGICTFLFHPELNYPIKEHEIHSGRKRVDIKFNNAAVRGFFNARLASPQTRSISILLECKNYSKKIDNPEMDQLSSRFGLQRGFFGFLLCRSMDDRERIIQRCRDTVNDGRGYMIVLEDIDLIEMLEMVENNARSSIDQYLSQRFDEIVN